MYSASSSPSSKSPGVSGNSHTNRGSNSTKRLTLALLVALFIHTLLLAFAFTKGPTGLSHIPDAKSFPPAQVTFVLPNSVPSPALAPPKEESVPEAAAPTRTATTKKPSSTSPKVTTTKALGETISAQTQGEKSGDTVGAIFSYGEDDAPRALPPPVIILAPVERSGKEKHSRQLHQGPEGSLVTKPAPYFVKEKRCLKDPRLCRTPGFAAKIDAEGNITLRDTHLGIESAVSPEAFERHEINGRKSDIDNSTPRANVAIPFDITDEYARMMGRDPYRSAKNKLLNETRDLRIARQERAREIDNLRAQRNLKVEALEVIVAQTKTPAIKRSILFDLWDECSTEESGLQARRMLELLMVRHFPAGTALAFTDEELLRLNKRKESKQTFAPYPEDATAFAINEDAASQPVEPIGDERSEK